MATEQTEKVTIVLSRDQIRGLKDIADEMFEAIPKSRRYEYLGHLNELCLALEGRALERQE